MYHTNFCLYWHFLIKLHLRNCSIRKPTYKLKNEKYGNPRNTNLHFTQKTPKFTYFSLSEVVQNDSKPEMSDYLLLRCHLDIQHNLIYVQQSPH